MHVYTAYTGQDSPVVSVTENSPALSPISSHNRQWCKLGIDVTKSN